MKDKKTESLTKQHIKLAMQECKVLTAIPIGLFDSSNSVPMSDFNLLFAKCNNLTPAK